MADVSIMASWRPEGGWLTLLFVAVGCAAVLGGVAVALLGRPGGRLATGTMLGYLVVTAAAAAARINLAIDRGRSDLDMVAILVACGLAGAAVLVAAPGALRSSAVSMRRTTAGGVLTVAAVCMLVIAVFANLEPPS